MHGWMKAVVLSAGLAASGAFVGASLAAETGHHGPDGFSDIPYGSPLSEAMSRNHGNGQIANDTLIYTTAIAGMTFSVTQNYDRNRRATDANAVTTITEPPRGCVARFNYVLDLLQASYGPPSAPPLASKVPPPGGKGQTTAHYAVSFTFDRNDGIDVQLNAPDPAGSDPGPCQISLHYLPPGWVGHF